MYVGGVHVSTMSWGWQRCWISLNVWLQEGVSHLMWVLGMRDGPLQEQYLLLFTELSLQVLFQGFKIVVIYSNK